MDSRRGSASAKPHRNHATINPDVGMEANKIVLKSKLSASLSRAEGERLANKDGITQMAS